MTRSNAMSAQAQYGFVPTGNMADRIEFEVAPELRAGCVECTLRHDGLSAQAPCHSCSEPARSMAACTPRSDVLEIPHVRTVTRVGVAR